MNNFMIVFDNLPFKVKGFTIHHAADDYYTIVLNARLSNECQKNTLKHELLHIARQDFQLGLDVNLIEKIAH